MTVAAAELVVRRVQLAPNPSVIRHGAAPSSSRRDHRHQLPGDAQVAAEHPLAHGQRVADGDGDHGQVGQHDPPPGGGDHGQQRAEHGQVRQRVDEREQEGARPFAGPVELRAEQRGPADHQQGDGHHVAVREPGQHRTRRALLRGAVTSRSAMVSTAMPIGHGGQGQQRRQVGEGQRRERGSGFRRGSPARPGRRSTARRRPRATGSPGPGQPRTGARRATGSPPPRTTPACRAPSCSALRHDQPHPGSFRSAPLF